MLSTTEFAEFAKDVVPFCHLTTRIEGHPHDDLLRQKGGGMFPYMAFLDADGRVLAAHPERSVDGLRQKLEGDVAEFLTLREKAATGDVDARRELFVKRVELKHFDDFAAARAELRSLDGLSDDLRAELTQKLVDQEFNLILGTARSEDDAVAAGALCLPMYQDGRIPNDRLAPYFWFFLASHAIAERDAERVAEAIRRLETFDHARAKRVLPELREALAGLQKDG